MHGRRRSIILFLIFRLVRYLPRLNDQSEHTMTPGTPLVPISLSRPAISVPSLDHFANTFETGDDFFAEVDDACVGDCGPNCTRGEGREKIIDCLIVDLQVGCAQQKFTGGGL